MIFERSLNIMNTQFLMKHKTINAFICLEEDLNSIIYTYIFFYLFFCFFFIFYLLLLLLFCIIILYNK